MFGDAFVFGFWRNTKEIACRESSNFGTNQNVSRKYVNISQSCASLSIQDLGFKKHHSIFSERIRNPIKVVNW
jgi:hypothetical protein